MKDGYTDDPSIHSTLVCVQKLLLKQKAHILELLNSTPWKNMYQINNIDFWRGEEGMKFGSAVSWIPLFILTCIITNF